MTKVCILIGRILLNLQISDLTSPYLPSKKASYKNVTIQPSRNVTKKSIFFIFSIDTSYKLCYYITCLDKQASGCGGMADASDSKSDGGDLVRVQVPPSALDFIP